VSFLDQHLAIESDPVPSGQRDVRQQRKSALKK
jgi:hypothetical protein